jgi:hypothetical protein
MTRPIHAKVKGASKRQAVARLSHQAVRFRKRIPATGRGLGVTAGHEKG